MADSFLQFVSIQPSQSVKTTSPQAQGGKSIPHGSQSIMGGLYSDRRKRACTKGK